MSRLIMAHKMKHHFATFGLALFLFLTPFEYPMADILSVSPLRLVGIFAMMLAALDIFRRGTFTWDYRLAGTAVWLIWGAISYAWCIDRVRFLDYFPIYFNNAVMFFLITMVKFSEKEIVYLKRAMVCGVACLLLYMFLVPGAITYSAYDHRLTLAADKVDLDQNYLSALMVMAFATSLNQVVNGEKHDFLLRTMLILLCVSICYVVILTGSRSGLIALGIVTLLCVNLNWKTRLYIGIPLTLLILIGGPLVLTILPGALAERFSFAAMTGNVAESSVRLNLWSAGLESLKNFGWVFGYGAGTSQMIVDKYYITGQVLHNHHLAMLVELGVVGLISSNYPVMRMIKEGWQKDRGLSTGVVGILAMAFFLDVVIAKFYWASIMLLSACISAKKSIESVK